MVVSPTTYPPSYVPFQGLVQLHKEDHKVADALLEKAEEDFDGEISVWCAPSLVDIRPFTWRHTVSHKSNWLPKIRYTYICTKESRLEPRARANLTGAEVAEVAPDVWFGDWADQPWVGPVDVEKMTKIIEFDSVKAYGDGDGVAVWGLDTQDRGYYIASVGKPTNVMVHLIKEHASTDLVGCNSPQRSLYKRGFGGLLRTYYGHILP